MTQNMPFMLTLCSLFWVFSVHPAEHLRLDKFATLRQIRG